MCCSDAVKLLIGFCPFLILCMQMMRYEQCVRKKLRSLFEYLDTDGDGKITQQCLLHGLARLHSHQLAMSAAAAAAGQSGLSGDSRSACMPFDGTAARDATVKGHSSATGGGTGRPPAGAMGTSTSTGGGADRGPDGEVVMDQSVCEYSIEELIRCVPDADEKGAITLKAFLDAEATLLPKLTHLKLLQ